MVTRYRDLLDVHVEVDTSALQAKLEELSNESWSEDTINDLIEQKLSNDGYLTSDDVERTVTDKIEEYDYLTGDDVDAKLVDYISHDDLSQQVDDAIEGTGLQAQVDALQGAVDALTERLDALAENNRTAMTFFDLIKQAFALLQNR